MHTFPRCTCGSQRTSCGVSLHYVGYEDWTQTFRFGVKCLYQISSLSGIKLCNLVFSYRVAYYASIRLLPMPYILVDLPLLQLHLSSIHPCGWPLKLVKPQCPQTPLSYHWDFSILALLCSPHTSRDSFLALCPWQTLWSQKSEHSKSLMEVYFQLTCSLNKSILPLTRLQAFLSSSFSSFLSFCHSLTRSILFVRLSYEDLF